MEALQANITTTCPLAFVGVTGALFAKAITTMVAAHCSILDDYTWPKDNAEEILGKNQGDLSYDFIIVGAGTAGSLVAGRLAQLYPMLPILLIEAGDDPGLASEIPMFLFFNHNTTLDWHYDTETQNKSCLGFERNSCIWNKGKGLGGSSAINVMLYLRGHPRDYNEWKELGNSHWGHEYLKPYFERIENDYELTNYNYQENPLYSILEGAWNESGLPQHENDNEEATTGFRKTKIITRNGKRYNTAKLYLTGTKNLHIMKNTMVDKIILEQSTNTAKGVIVKNNSGILAKINAKKEVILSAGSVATPQILMLSGIGPKEHLEENGINCTKDLPVGKNLQDHVIVPIFLKTNQSTTLPPEVITFFFAQYMLFKTGPFAGIGITDFMSFIDTRNFDYPDIQYHHTYFPMKDNFLLRPYLEGLGCREHIIRSIEKLNVNNDILGIYPTLLRPKSKGEILLANNNSQNHPIIKPNYFDDPDDVSTLLKGIFYLFNLEKTKTFESLGIKVPKLDIPQCSTESDKYWDCYIRHMATTIYHPVGTARMGPEDGNSVVDDNLLVHGVKKLRIVDASVMPTIPGANTMATTLAIAEKAVDIIKEQYRIKDKTEL